MTAPQSGLKRSDFDYRLPPELIAQGPLSVRSASRLLLLDAPRALWRDLQMDEFPGLLEPGDLLVFNDTRVLPARLLARKSTGGRIELLLERALTQRQALVQLRDSKSIREGMVLTTAGGPVRVVARCGEFWQVEMPSETVPFFEAYGHIPLPPYIRRAADPQDRERYQSVFARVPGAVAAPTASLHFDRALLERLSARGIGRSCVTLHVGAGTFQPLRTEQLEHHTMHSEHYSVSPQTVALIERARAAGGRIVAVGTTVARALESAAQGARGAGGELGAHPAPSARLSAEVVAGSGDTTLFIRPGYRFRVIDALLTNFHLPQSTLLMLVAALAGRELLLAAYEHAIAERYRFFSYGDAMLILPREPR